MWKSEITTVPKTLRYEEKRVLYIDIVGDRIGDLKGGDTMKTGNGATTRPRQSSKLKKPYDLVHFDAQCSTLKKYLCVQVHAIYT